MSRWEYQVIHLNVEDSSQAANPPGPGPASPPEPPAPVAPPGNPAPLAGQPGFSKAYLEQEFPNFYSNPAQQQPQPPQQANHPALQLQNFLNGHGQKGWSLVGIYPLGSLLMMFFRRRIPDPPSPQVQAAPSVVSQLQRQPQSAEPFPVGPDPVPTAGMGSGAGPASASPAHGVPSPPSDVLQQILQRLDSLEGRAAPLPSRDTQSGPGGAPAAVAASPPDTLAQPSQGPGERRLRRRTSASQEPSPVQAPPLEGGRQTTPAAGSPAAAVDVAIVSTHTLASLQSEVGIPTFHAAKALDFRSYATLAGFGSRHGYPLGLIKEGANGMVAVYVGLEQGDRGGRAKRLWVVIPVDRLRALDNR